MPNPVVAPHPPARPGDPIDLHDSVAGEEDPGASIDLATPTGTEWSPGRSDPAPAERSGEDRPKAAADE